MHLKKVKLLMHTCYDERAVPVRGIITIGSNYYYEVPKIDQAQWEVQTSQHQPRNH